MKNLYPRLLSLVPSLLPTMQAEATKLLMAAAALSLPMAVNAQTENPRGIYKMITLVGTPGEVTAPFDQYKICTDSLTLTLSVRNAFFRLSNGDRQVFNYTGEQPKDENDKRPLIYDSNAEHFTLKWWSNNPYHPYFPANDWCLEKYESGRFSETGKIIFDALTGTAATSTDNPLMGTWCIMGYMDELRNTKKELERLHEQYPTSKFFNSFLVFTPQNRILINGSGGGVSETVYEGKKAYRTGGNKPFRVKWLSKNRVALEERIDYRTDWMILERVTDGTTPLSHIAGLHIQKQQKR